MWMTKGPYSRKWPPNLPYAVAKSEYSPLKLTVIEAGVIGAKIGLFVHFIVGLLASDIKKIWF